MRARLARGTRLLVVVVLLVLLGGPTASAAPPDPVPAGGPTAAPVMLVVDTSGSMGDQDGAGTVKLEGARRALLALIGALPATALVGMRTYPGSGGDCGPGQPEFDVAALDAGQMSARVRGFTADGGTPTAEALRAAGDDLRRQGYTAATVVLVSDGESTCGKPCQVAAALRSEGLDVVVNTVGFQISAGGAEELQCIADATGGSYHDARDSAALAEELAATQVPDLDVDLVYEPTYSLADAAQLEITARVENESEVLAEDLRASIVFDADASGGSPTVLRPLRVLGNLDPGGRLQVDWQVYPGLVGDDDIGDRLDFSVVLSTRYGRPVVQQGSVTVAATQLSDAAPWLADADEVVVLGDSYSSGEGAGDYTDEQEGIGACHRSPHTYAEALYAGTDTEVVNLACSGAVTADYTRAQPGRDVEPQRGQLAGYGDYDLVMLTMGGNDVHFSSIIQNCVTGRECSGEFRCVLKGLVECLGDQPAWWADHLADLRVNLRGWYQQVLQDTRGVPVVVLPYVHPVPASGTVTTGCSGTTALGIEFSPYELALIQWLQVQLDEQIRLAVADVADPRLLYAADVADALQPAHTLCSEDRWIVGLSDRGLGGTVSADQELAHPTKEGYAAVARALIRWSTTQDPPRQAGAGGSVLSWFARGVDAAASGLAQVVAGTPTVDLQDTADPVGLPAGGTLTVRASGFGAGQQVLVTVRSTSQALCSVAADEDGAVEVEVALPDSLPPGEHTLLAEGYTTDGAYQVVGTALDVGPRAPWGGLLLAGAGAVVAGLGLLVLRRGRAYGTAPGRRTARGRRAARSAAG